MGEFQAGGSHIEFQEGRKNEAGGKGLCGIRRPPILHQLSLQVRTSLLYVPIYWTWT
jgi:hypothetical protein